MNFTLPTKFHDWLNVEIWSWVRRIDVILTVLCIGCVAYYAYTSGLKGALLGFIAFMLFAWVGMFFRDTSGG